jgi:hypothetical protein
MLARGEELNNLYVCVLFFMTIRSPSDMYVCMYVVYVVINTVMCVCVCVCPYVCTYTLKFAIILQSLAEKSWEKEESIHTCRLRDESHPMELPGGIGCLDIHLWNPSLQKILTRIPSEKVEASQATIVRPLC